MNITTGTNLAAYMVWLQDNNTHELGFIPRDSLTTMATKGRVLPEFENDELCGYLLPGPIKKHTRIYQLCVQDDARRIIHGTDLVSRMIAACKQQRAHTLTLHCAQDLDANKFWPTLGFQHTGERCRRKDGRRKQNRWTLELPAKGEDERRFAAQLEQDGQTRLYAFICRSAPGVKRLNWQKKHL